MEPTRLELRLADAAGVLLGSSMVFALVFLFLIAAVMLGFLGAVIAGVVVLTYLSQLYYLGQLKKASAHRRLKIWEGSLLAHLVVFGAAIALLRDPGLAVVLLLPETLSAICHMVAVIHIRRSAVAA